MSSILGSGRNTLPLLLLLMLAAGCAPQSAPVTRAGGEPPAVRDFATSRPGAKGIFRATYRSEPERPALDEVHTWALHVERADGLPVENAVIGVSGELPELRRGLPAQPRVTKYAGGGNYRVEGMRFPVAGWWTVTFVINAEGKQDGVTFNLQVE